MFADAALADLARRALERPDAVSVMTEAVGMLAAALRVEHVTILELGPGDGHLRLRAGIGWADGAIGTRVDAMPGGHVAYTLAEDAPVVVARLADERRFVPSPLLLGAGIVSSLSVRIPSGGPGPYGVIGAHATCARAFSPEEIGLLQGVAAVVAATIANQRRALEVNDGVLQSLVLAHYALASGDGAAAARAVHAAHDAARKLVEDLLGAAGTEPLPGDLRRSAPAQGPQVRPPA